MLLHRKTAKRVDLQRQRVVLRERELCRRQRRNGQQMSSGGRRRRQPHCRELDVRNGATGTSPDYVVEVELVRLGRCANGPDLGRERLARRTVAVRLGNFRGERGEDAQRQRCRVARTLMKRHAEDGRRQVEGRVADLLLRQVIDFERLCRHLGNLLLCDAQLQLSVDPQGVRQESVAVDVQQEMLTVHTNQLQEVFELLHVPRRAVELSPQRQIV